ncbi:MAG: hypothetical protein ABIG93_04650 [archaeon]
MSKFEDQVKSEVLSVVSGYMTPSDDKPQRYRSETIPMDLTSKLPEDLTAVGVRNAIVNTHGQYGKQKADKVLAVYSPEDLLYADLLLDRLDLVGTPDDGFIERLEAIKSVIDLKRRLQDDGKPEKTLLDTMASYWNQVPIFYGDLNTIFHVMATEYQDHHKFSDFKNWCFGYAFRDGILEVAEKVIEKYGVEFDAEVHESGFGLAKHGERRILPGVSAEEFMTTLCQLSKSLANNSHWSGNINARYINSGARDWEKALTKARDLTLKEQSNISSRLELM